MISAENPLLSILIVNYNVYDHLNKCIPSIHSFLKYPFEIIIVDNASSDNSVELLSKNFPDVRLIRNSDNVGFSAANNQGAKLANGELLLLLNPDTELLDSSLDRMLSDFISGNNKKNIIGPRLLNSDGSHQTSCWRFPTVFQHFLSCFFLNYFFRVNEYSWKDLHNNATVDFLSGAALLMDKNHYTKLNGLDNQLFWMDDVDLCYRNMKTGGQNIFYASSSIKHYSGSSSKNDYRISTSNQLISKLKFYKKHRLFTNYYLSCLIFFIHIVLRIALFLPLTLINVRMKLKFKAYLYTFRKFLRYLILNDTLLT
jgi:GT2 family glycosyltransferase